MQINTVLDYENLFTHCSLIGTTGSGKTSYMLAIIKEIILKNNMNSILFIDGKNDKKLAKVLQEYAKNSGYSFYVYSNNLSFKSNFHYLSFHNKTYFEIKEIIAKLRTKEITNNSLGATYYLNLSNKLIFLIIKTLIKNKIKLTWTNLANYCNKYKLKEIVDDNDEAEFKSYNKETYQDALAFLQDFSENEENIPETEVYSLQDLINKNEKNIILFSLDFLTFPNLSKDLAQNVCLDLRQSLKNKALDLFCFFDEFGSYINQDLKIVLEQGRSHRTGLILSYQSLAQINKDNFKNIVFDNTNNWFIFNMKHELSLKEIAGLFGYKKILNLHYNLDLTADNPYSNKGGVNVNDTYYVSPDEIRNLKPLQAFIKTIKTPRYFSSKIDLNDINSNT